MVVSNRIDMTVLDGRLYYERLTRFTASQIIKVRKSNQVKSPSLLNQIKKSGKSAFMLDWQSSKALNTRVISGSYGFDE